MRLTEVQLRKTVRALLIRELFVSPKKKKAAGKDGLGMSSKLKKVLDREPSTFSYGDPEGGTSYAGFGDFEEDDSVGGDEKEPLPHADEDEGLEE